MTGRTDIKMAQPHDADAHAILQGILAPNADQQQQNPQEYQQENPQAGAVVVDPVSIIWHWWST